MAEAEAVGEVIAEEEEVLYLDSPPSPVTGYVRVVRITSLRALNVSSVVRPVEEVAEAGE